MYEINLPIYKQEVHLVIEKTSIDCCNIINESHSNEDKLELIDARGFFWDTNYKNKGILKKRFYLAMSEDSFDDTTLEHEVIHLAWAILEHVGVRINSKNHEAFTYLFEHLLTECRNEIKKLNLTS